jgi:hypothetical protein
VVAEIEKKENTTTRAMNMTSRRHAARREHAETKHGGRRCAWKRFEARRRRAGGGALPLAGCQLNYENATGDNSQITLNFSIEVENL